MADFLQTLVIAVTLGSLYALIALGYTMVYGVLKLINFAHSDIVVLGAWISLTVATFLLPFLGLVDPSQHWWAAIVVLLLAMSLCGLIGFFIERLAYKPIRKAPRLNALITAIGVSLLLQNAGQLQYTLLENESVVGSGAMQERGSDPKTVRLTSRIELEPDTAYSLRMIRNGAVADRDGRFPGRTLRVLASAGTIDAGADIAVDQSVSRSESRESNFQLIRIASHPPLKLPFGAMPARMPPLLSDVELMRIDFVSQTAFGEVKKPVRITLLDVVIVATAGLLMVALQVLVFGTRVGTAMRAVSFNMDTAALMGIPVNRIVSITFVTGTALAAAAGFLYALKYTQVQQPAHATWVLLGLKAFVAAVVGGIGNIRGATVGGFLIAFIEQFSSWIGLQIGWDNASAYPDVFVFALLIIMLLVRPAGLFGSTQREKV
jgi:branched-subunit amino acid ABC-type transport system permease component